MFDLTGPEATTALWTIVLGALCNSSCALVGCFLVLRRQSLMGDAISHSVLPGIVIAFLLSGQTTSWPVWVGALAMGALTSVLTQLLHLQGDVPEDASMGVVFTSLFALGVVLLANFAGQVHLDADCVLYGEIGLAATDTVSVGGWEVPRSLAPLGLCLVATVLFLAVLWKELKVTSFDPQFSQCLGKNVWVVHYLLMAMVAGVTVAAFEAVGSILVVAMLIVPAATAQLLAERLRTMLAWAVAVAVVSAILGYWGARQLNTTVAGMMAVAAGGQFCLAVFLAPKQGLASRALRHVMLMLRIAAEDELAGLYRAEEAPLGSHSQPARHGVLAASARWLLKRRAQIEPGAFGPRLTASGRAAAQSVVRAHRLWEAYLGENFQLPLDHLHAPAERIEHFLGPNLQDQLASALERPAVDPHGRAIPAPVGAASGSGSTPLAEAREKPNQGPSREP